MLIAVDIGNSRTVSGQLRGKKVLSRSVIPTRNLKSFSQTKRWAQSLQKAWKGQDTVVSSVVSGVDLNVKKALRETFKKKPLFVDVKSDPGLPVHYKKPYEIGADRVMNALAAKTLYGAPVIVVDYGTGTTFDVVNKAGDYFGGAILPGLGISVRALHEFTAKIPLVKFEKVNFAIGRTTEEAVRSGVYHGAIGTTKELLFNIRKELKSSAPAIATGGFCQVFKPTGLFKQVEPDLTLKGIAAIWRKLNAS